MKIALTPPEDKLTRCELGSHCKWPPFQGWLKKQTDYQYLFIHAHAKYCGGQLINYCLIENSKHLKVNEEIEKLRNSLKELIPMAEEYYERISKKSAGHQEFIIEDREAINKAKSLMDHQ